MFRVHTVSIHFDLLLSALVSSEFLLRFISWTFLILSLAPSLFSSHLLNQNNETKRLEEGRMGEIDGISERELWRNATKNMKLYFRWETQSLTHYTESHRPTCHSIKSSVWQHEQYTIFSMRNQIEAKHLRRKKIISRRVQYTTHGLGVFSKFFLLILIPRQHLPVFSSRARERRSSNASYFCV